MKIDWHPEPTVVASVKSVDNASIRLTEERWLHIVEYHKELTSFQVEVLLTVTSPEKVFQSPAGQETNFAAVKSFDRLADFGLAKNLIVHYKKLSKSNGFILTAFVMSDKRLTKRFKLWQKLK